MPQTVQLQTSRSVSYLIAKARKGAGLSPEEILSLFRAGGPDDWQGIFEAARDLTCAHFAGKLRFFAPLYFSNLCVNDCEYCGFQTSNTALKRRALSLQEFVDEARYLWDEGHRTLLLVAAEHPLHAGVSRVEDYMAALRKTGLDFFVMAEIGPLTVDEYRKLRAAGISQCVLFQETYQRDLYGKLHRRGPKKDFQWRYDAMTRAMEGGFRKVGLGFLLGLHAYPEDCAEMARHAWEIKKRFGVFPETFSLPRLRPAYGVEPPAGHPAVPDEDFKKIVAVMRLAFPQTGLVLSTRETPSFRDHLLESGIGITHMSAGCSTMPGGYTLEKIPAEGSQFSISDNRPLCEVVERMLELGYDTDISVQPRREKHAILVR